MSKDNKQICRQQGDGWENLLAPILEEADRVDAEITQVKEKYGRMRVYFTPGSWDTDKLEEMIDQAEKDSATVCELCGKPGVMFVKGQWLKTICASHALDLGYKQRA